MDELLSPRDKIINKLTPTEGEELEIMCNLTHSGQANIFLEEVGYTELGSSYIIRRTNMLKRLTCSFNARARDDLTKIGMTPEFRGAGGGGFIDK